MGFQKVTHIVWQHIVDNLRDIFCKISQHINLQNINSQNVNAYHFNVQNINSQNVNAYIISLDNLPNYFLWNCDIMRCPREPNCPAMMPKVMVWPKSFGPGPCPVRLRISQLRHNTDFRVKAWILGFSMVYITPNLDAPGSKIRSVS